jgi:hypothetical protein
MMDAVLRVKLPLKFGWQPEGAAAEGAMPSLTACATAVAARQRVERTTEDLILVAGGTYTIFLICAFKYVQRPTRVDASQLNAAPTKEECDKQAAHTIALR